MNTAPDYSIHRRDGQLTVELPCGDGSVSWEFLPDEVGE